MTDTEIGIITARDKRELRAAGTVTFHLHNGESYIQANRSDHSFHRINVPWLITDYDKTARDVSYEARDVNYSGYAWTLGVHTDEMRTLLYAMTPGTQVTLHWRKDNNNDYIRKIGWHRDELLVRLTRNGVTRHYLAAVSVGPDNLGRMIQLRSMIHRVQHGDVQ